MPFADRGTHRLSFETLGREDAPPLLLVMGMSFSARAWGPMPERLAREFRVVVFDNRGAGESTAPLRPFGMGDLADDAAAVLEAAGVGPAFVFGISMGGMIALELALRHPERVRALALGATFAGWRTSRKATAAGDGRARLPEELPLAPRRARPHRPGARLAGARRDERPRAVRDVGRGDGARGPARPRAAAGRGDGLGCDGAARGRSASRRSP